MANKKTRAYTKKFKMPRLFRDQLQEIENIFINDLKAEDYKIETKDYEYSSLNEIPKDLKGTNDLIIRSSRPYLSISLEKSCAQLYCGTRDLNDTLLGTLTRIQEIIHLSERNTLFIISKSIFWLFWLPVIFVLVPEFSGKILHFTKLQSAVYILASIIFLLIFLTSLIFSLFKFSQVYFVKKSELPSFFAKNKDEIKLIIISVISGAIINSFFNYFLKQS